MPRRRGSLNLTDVAVDSSEASILEDGVDTITFDDIVRIDSALTNLSVGIGDRRQEKLLNTTVNHSPRRLSYHDKEVLFNTNSFCHAVCSTVPEKAIAGGWEVTLGSDTKEPEKVLTALRAYDRRIAEVDDDDGDNDLDGSIFGSTEELFGLAQTWANAKDGAVILLHVDDGRPPYEPINRNRIKTIVSAEVLDRTEIRPVITSAWNPLHPKYYELLVPENLLKEQQEKYAGAMPQEMNSNAYYFHRSRVIRFDGNLTTRRWMLENEGWGGSPLDLLWDEFNRWKITQDSLAGAINDFSMFVHSVKQLKTILSRKNREGEKAVMMRLQDMREEAQATGGVAIDMDNEKLDYLNRQFTGITDITKDFRDSLIGATRLPHTLLFGESPSGLGATGESEENTIANLVKEFQENVWKPKLMRLYRLIFLAKDGPTGGKEPEGWGLRFNSLIPESESEKATARQTQAQTDNIYLAAEVVTKDEVRSSRFGGEDYSFVTNLDEEAWEEKKVKDAEQADPYAAFGAADPMAALPPGMGDPLQDPLDAGVAEFQQDSLRLDREKFPDQQAHAQAVKEAKAKFKIFPSAYAGMWIARRYKELAKNRRAGGQSKRGDAAIAHLPIPAIVSTKVDAEFPNATAHQQATLETQTKFKSVKSAQARAFLKQRYREISRKQK